MNTGIIFLANADPAIVLVPLAALAVMAAIVAIGYFAQSFLMKRRAAKLREMEANPELESFGVPMPFVNMSGKQKKVAT